MSQSTLLPPPEEPVPNNDQPVPAVVLPDSPGVPDMCRDGYTVVTVVPCVPSPATPSPEVACQNLAWRDQISYCENIPLRGQLPETGAASLPIAGTGLFALLAGVALLRAGRRRYSPS
jgi:LPXTG-motif cell wall-anchored protein